MNRSDRVAAARGDAPADLLLNNARIVQAYTGDVEQADVAVAGSWIVGVGRNHAARNLSDQPLESVLERTKDLLASARELGSTLHELFHALSFLGLK